MSIVVRVLGTAQDGGVPQIACSCDNCAAARLRPANRRRVSSIGAVNPATGWSCLFDATWDMPEQLQMLAAVSGKPLPDAIFLTHAHVGHYVGLLHLGREILSSRRLAVYCTDSVAAFLGRNLPWGDLISGGHILPHRIVPGESVTLDPAITVRAAAVPHRSEYSDAVGYLVRASGRGLLYLPDLDSWDGFEHPFNELMLEADHALIDGTFFSPGELERSRGRSTREVPHPPIERTEELFRRGILDPAGATIHFTHFNHTNPVLNPADERRGQLRAAGLSLAADGQLLRL
ncbi:MAG: MBL fold metallo-hydrolase [Bacillota bacterium]